MRIIENSQLNTLINLLSYHINKVNEYSLRKKNFDLRAFYDKLPRAVAKDKFFISIDKLSSIAKVIEECENLSLNDLSAMQSQFWSPYYDIMFKVNGK